MKHACTIANTACLVLYMLLVVVSRSDGFLTCRECKDVDNPKVCPDSITCGHGELCVSREFVDHLGQHGFRLGCESQQMCSLLRAAQLAVGRRHSSPAGTRLASKPLCHECCATDDCNADLCHDSMGSIMSLLPQTHTGFITCRECKDIEDPRSCSDSMICGYEEICVTREFTNHNDQQGFRMGCESNRTCELLSVAQAGFGKRGTPITFPPSMCHSCCETTNCNSALCHDVVTNLVTTAPPHHDCLYYFGDSCYMIGYGVLNWTASRELCRSWGGDLMVFNSAREHLYWKNTLTDLKATNMSSLWLGGVYSHAAGAWFWVDGPVTHYTLWYNNAHLHPHAEVYALLLNPGHADHTTNIYLNAMMSQSSNNQRPFICEKHTP